MVIGVDPAARWFLPSWLPHLPRIALGDHNCPATVAGEWLGAGRSSNGRALDTGGQLVRDPQDQDELAAGELWAVNFACFSARRGIGIFPRETVAEKRGREFGKGKVNVHALDAVVSN